VPDYVRPVWPAWDPELLLPEEHFLEEAHRSSSLVELWDRCQRPDSMLWLYDQGIQQGLLQALPTKQVYLFSCWCIRRGLDMMRQRPGNARALAQLDPFVEQAERATRGESFPADAQALLPDSHTYFNSVADGPNPEPDGHSHAYWACHKHATEPGLRAAVNASEFAAWFAGYAAVTLPISEEEYGDDVHPRAWYPAATCEYAAHAHKLRELMGNPFLAQGR
jgi:hypothetical protein